MALCACLALFNFAQIVSAQTTRIMSYNIRSGSNVYDVYNVTLTGVTIASFSPDLVGIQEVDQFTGRHPGDDQPMILANITGMNVRYGRMRDFMGGGFGIAVLSKFPILETREFHYSPPGGNPTEPLRCQVPLPNDYCQGMVAIRVQPPGFPSPFWFATTHLQVADSDLNETLELMNFVYSLGGNVVLAGDFNSAPTSPAIKFMTKYMFDMWGTFMPGNPGLTYDSLNPSTRDDYQFILKGQNGKQPFKVVNPVVPVTLSSDHRPVIADYTFVKSDFYK